MHTSNTPIVSKRKFSILSLLLMVFNLVLIKSIDAQGITNRRIIRHAPNVDPLEALSDQQTQEAEPIVILHAETFTLTRALVPDRLVSQVNGVVYNDENIQVPVYDEEIIVDDPLGPSNNTNSSQECVLELPAGVPKCNANIGNNVRVAIIDSVFKKTPYLNHPVTSLGSFVGDEQCLSHGGYVAGIINQMIPSGAMEFNSVGVFDCTGRGWTSDVIAGVNLVIKAAAQNPNIRYVINYSGGGGANTASDLAFIEAENNGIATYVSAGNGGADCRGTSPARAAASSSVSSIGASCGQAPCSFTNYEVNSAFPAGQCVTINLPGCVSSVNPLTGVLTNICGTSFSSPIGAGRHAIAAGRNPGRGVQEIKQLLTIGVTKVNVIGGSHFTGQWDVLDSAFSCPVENTSDEIFPGTLQLTNADSGKFKNWYPGSEVVGSFCVKFEANTLRGALVVGTRSASDVLSQVRVEIGMRKGTANRPWLHRLSESVPPQPYVTIDSKTTKERIVDKNFKEFTVQSSGPNFLVQYKNKQGQQTTLFSKNITNPVAEVAFSTYGGGVRVRNAKRCVI